MDLVHPVHGAKQVGLPGAWRTAADIDTADRALTAEENGAAGGVFQIGVVARLQPSNGGDGLVQGSLRGVEVPGIRTKETPRRSGAQFTVDFIFRAVSVISDPSGGAVWISVPGAHPPRGWMADIFSAGPIGVSNEKLVVGSAPGLPHRPAIGERDDGDDHRRHHR